MIARKERDGKNRPWSPPCLAAALELPHAAKTASFSCVSAGNPAPTLGLSELKPSANWIERGPPI